MKNLFTWKYWFTVNPEPLTALAFKVLIAINNKTIIAINTLKAINNKTIIAFKVLIAIIVLLLIAAVITAILKARAVNGSGLTVNQYFQVNRFFIVIV